MTAGSGDLWVPRFLLGVGAHFHLVGTTRKVATYRNCPQKTYEWRMWTGMESIRDVCIKFPLHGVH
jgi:hypothetical protein